MTVLLGRRTQHRELPSHKILSDNLRSQGVDALQTSIITYQNNSEYRCHDPPPLLSPCGASLPVSLSSPRCSSSSASSASSCRSSIVIFFPFGFCVCALFLQGFFSLPRPPFGLYWESRIPPWREMERSKRWELAG